MIAGDHHRKQRRMLNPVFSIKNIRNLTPLFYSVVQKVCHGAYHYVAQTDSNISVRSYQLRDAILIQTKDGPQELDMLMWMSRAALEIIGTGGLGTSIDPLVPDPMAITEYGKSIKNLM